MDPEGDRSKFLKYDESPLTSSLTITLLAYIVQLVTSSESMAPSNPKRAPEAPTEMFVWMKSDDNKLPPSPEMTYINPIRTARETHKNWTKGMS